MRKSEKEKCTELTEGTIIERYVQVDSPDRIAVRYNINAHDYDIVEPVYTMAENGKFYGKQVPVMGNISKGTVVKVKYNPADPAKAYLVDNDSAKRYILKDIYDLFRK